jgi:hypothetical protein
VLIARRARNQHNTLFLILGAMGYDLKKTFAQPWNIIGSPVTYGVYAIIEEYTSISF